ncbi:hypothetical protein EDD22DRAFT_972070 [Suillus occidentalis]|nr:hypothetical protein EDD22DRAFT_972070 [Suillus occidentalis]
MTSTLSTETIAGIVIVVVGGAAVVISACLYIRRWSTGRGKFLKLRRREREADPEEEFVSGGSNLSVHERVGRYGHGQQPSVSLEPLLLPSPPQTAQGSPASSPPQIPLDWSYTYLPPVLPNPIPDTSPLSLYDTPDDPFARIQRAILPTHTPISSRRVSHEVPLEQYSRHTPKNPGANPPLFINRALIRHSGPDFFPGRASTSPFSSADPPLSVSSRTGSDTLTDVAPPLPPKPQISVISPVAALSGSREGAQQPRRADSDVDSPESIYSQESAPHPPHPPSHQVPPPPPPSRKSKSLRYSKTPRISDLSPVIEDPTSSGSPSHDASASTSTSSEIEKKLSRTFSEIQRSSSTSVALSHNAPSPTPEYTSLPLLSSSNTFGKSGSSGSTLSPSSSRATRYPSLTPSSLAPSSSSSNPNPQPHSDSATEWHRPSAGLDSIQILDLPNPHASTLEIPKVPAHPHRPLPTDKCDKPPLKARLRAHSPGSIAEIEQRPIVQCGIASIDITV